MKKPKIKRDILDKLKDLHEQATKERSHYYVASCCREAIVEIEILRAHYEEFMDGDGKRG